MCRFTVAAATAAVLLVAFLPGGLTCATQPSGITVDRLMRLLDDAKARNGSGSMHLQGHGRGPTSAGYPIAEWPPGTEVVRAPEGATLVIPCHVTNNITLRIAPAFARNGLLTRLTGGPIERLGAPQVNYCCNCSKDHFPANYSMEVQFDDFDTGAFSILLPNFTYAATGLYECLHSNGSQRVVTQRYWVSATLFRDQVFDPPMQNLTVRYGDPAAMVCGVRFNFLPGYLKTRFLWRSGGYLLMGDSIPAVADQARSWWGFYGRFEFGIDDAGRCSSTMKIDSVKWKDAGWYECWFRINDRLDEWIMQEAYLHVV